MAFFRFLVHTCTLSFLIISTILVMQLALVNVADANPRKHGGRKIPSSHPPTPNMAIRSHHSACRVPPSDLSCCPQPCLPSTP
ncbi:hypothetical protein Pint_22047 [Pistacia integerrima]|uniref:Uncharacterized protein n=1 Tax=Pistacia integerrima TaxID=434235 RepID=A0ACC0YKL9_9ROSI|nr:hypothetical protein Pint_22047 [Pistacia integerrima]